MKIPGYYWQFLTTRQKLVVRAWGQPVVRRADKILVVSNHQQFTSNISFLNFKNNISWRFLVITDYKNNSLRESIINRNPLIIIYTPI